MRHHQTSTFTEAEASQVVAIASAYKERGWEFSQICATTLEDSVELLYAYCDPSYTATGLEGVRVNVPDGTSVPLWRELRGHQHRLRRRVLHRCRRLPHEPARSRLPGRAPGRGGLQ